MSAFCPFQHASVKTLHLARLQSLDEVVSWQILHIMRDRHLDEDGSIGMIPVMSARTTRSKRHRVAYDGRTQCRNQNVTQVASGSSAARSLSSIARSAGGMGASPIGGLPGGLVGRGRANAADMPERTTTPFPLRISAYCPLLVVALKTAVPVLFPIVIRGI